MRSREYSSPANIVSTSERSSVPDLMVVSSTGRSSEKTANAIGVETDYLSRPILITHVRRTLLAYLCAGKHARVVLVVRKRRRARVVLKMKLVNHKNNVAKQPGVSGEAILLEHAGKVVVHDKGFSATPLRGTGGTVMGEGINVTHDGTCARAQVPTCFVRSTYRGKNVSAQERVDVFAPLCFDHSG